MATSKRPDAPLAVALAWVERHAIIPDGFRKGDPLRLYDYQFRYLARFYRVRGTAKWNPDNPVLAPAFVYRRGLLVGPQKVGKGPFTAAHVMLEGLGPCLFGGWAVEGDVYECAEWGCMCGWVYEYEEGEPLGIHWPTPLIQLTAYAEDQVANVYDALKPMLRDGPCSALAKVGEEFIRLPNDGRIDVVTSSAQARLGQRVTFVVQDEVGIWTKFNKMTRVADTQYRGLAGMGGRASLTTNMWDPSERSVAQREYESKSKDVLRQLDRPPPLLSFNDKRERRRILKAVYPPDTLRENGGHIDLDSIEAEALDMLAHDPAQAFRFFGNGEVRAAGHAVDSARWRALADVTKSVPDGARIGLGFDGSISEDATALIGCWRDDNGTPHLFVPTHRVDGEDRPTIWLRPVRPDGAAVKGWKVPRLQVRRAIAAVFERYQVGRLYGDPPKWQTELEEWAEEWGEETVLLFDTNQPKRMSAACDRFTVHVGQPGDEERSLTHDGNGILTDHVVAMVRKKAYLRHEDPNDGRVRYIFTKGDDARKIDAGIGAVLALEAGMTMPEAPREKALMFAWGGDEGDVDDYDEDDYL